MARLNAPELLSPAGTFKNMTYAYAYGADAVYAGQPRYSLRVRNNDFDHKTLAKGIAYAHEHGKKFYVASNLLPHNSKLKTYIADMEPIIEMKPDALIMADPGLIHMVRERWPEMPIHLSVQANTMNYAAVQFWKHVGIERIILSRELGLEEIEEIRQSCPDMELEVFVHGALCIAYSGRCLLSGYFNHRDPNQGTCTNSCRWQYDVKDAVETDTGDIRLSKDDAINAGDLGVKQFNPSDKVFMLEEAGRPGEMMPIYEDEHGTYIMNSKDLRAVQHVQTLAKMGIDSLKIEGRTKSHFYAARTAQIYRQAIDDALEGREFDMSLMTQLDGMANRGFTEGFYRRHVPKEYQNYEGSGSHNGTQRFVGEITGSDHQNHLEIDVKNRFKVGDTLELVTPEGNHTFTLETLLDRYDNPVELAPGSGHLVKIPSPVSDSVNLEHALLLREEITI